MRQALEAARMAGADERQQRVVLSTHPIPQNYYLTHQALGTWQSDRWRERI